MSIRTCTSAPPSDSGIDSGHIRLESTPDAGSVTSDNGLTVRSMDVRTFQEEVKIVLEALPEWVTLEMENVVIVVERIASRDQDPSGDGLLGIYEGIPLPERGFDYFGVTPDRIVIFYEPHLELDLAGDDLRNEIRTTVLHEIGHHLGFTDERLHELGWG